eukprot:1678950-Alexandrium_andersonii.AAC.1
MSDLVDRGISWDAPRVPFRSNPGKAALQPLRSGEIRGEGNVARKLSESEWVSRGSRRPPGR